MSEEPRESGVVSAAVLGLGIIGSRVCERLAAGGLRVACWNRTPKGRPGEVATPAEAVAGAGVVSLYLKDSAAVRAVADALKSVDGGGRLLLNHSTLDLETTLWLADWAGERGWRFLDAPFTGSKVAAAEGKLVYYVGGDEEDVAEAEGYLLRSGRAVIPCGRMGAATIVKLSTNLISACTVQALAEASAVAARFGVPDELFQRAVAENACASPLSAMKLPGMQRGEFEPHFSLSNMAKDGRYALVLARAAGLETPALAAVSARMNALCERGHGDLDYSALAQPYRQSDP